MGITVAEAMRIFPLNEAVLVGGAGGMERNVESVNIQEVPNVAQWLHGGEIIFTCGYAFQNASGGVRMLHAINSKGAAALVLKTGQIFHEIPQEMKETADKLEMPLYQLPDDIPYMDCIIPLFEQLMQKKLYVLERINGVHDRMMRALLEGSGLKGMSVILQNATGRRIAIYTEHGNLLASGESPEINPNYWQTLEKYIKTRILTNIVGHLEKNKCNYLYNGDLRILCIPIFTNVGNIAYLFVDNTVPIEESETLLYENAASLVAMDVLKDWDVKNQENQLRSQLYNDILHYRHESETQLIRRGKFLQIDLEEKLCCFYINEVQHDRGQGISDRVSETKLAGIKTELHNIFRRKCSEYAIPYLYDDGTEMTAAGLFEIKSEEEEEICGQILKETLKELRQIYKSVHLAAGISMTHTLDKASAGSKEAIQAEKAAGMRGQEADPVRLYRDLGSMRILGDLSDSSYLKQYCRECLVELQKYDAKNDSELVKTLDTYLNCGRNVNRTAELMYLHKNTILNRMAKIETLTGKSLRDEETCFELQLSLKLISLYK